MAVYRFKKGITELLDRREGDRSAARLLRLDLADLTAIRDIRVEREPALELDVNGRPVGEPLTTFSGKPIFTDRSREVITLDVTFFVRTGQVSLISQELGANVDNMSISLVRVIEEEVILPVAASMINIGHLTTSRVGDQVEFLESSSLEADRADVANIQNNVPRRGEPGGDFLFPIRTSLKFSLEDALLPVGNDMQDLNLNLAGGAVIPMDQVTRIGQEAGGEPADSYETVNTGE